MGLPVGTGPNNLLTYSTNISGMGVAAALMHFGTTDSVSSTNLVYLMVSTVDSPRNTQYPPPRPLLFGVYSTPMTFSLPLSGYVTCSGCGMLSGGDPLLRQSE